jgi:uncharacterized protein YcnI
MHPRASRLIAAATAAGALAVPAAAGAHVTAAPIGDVPAEGYGKVDFRVPHGCDGSPTTAITVRLPDNVVGATPQVVPGWKISVKEGKLAKPVEAHGEQITEGVREVTWRGGPLPDHHLQEFGMSIQTSGKPGEKAWFKILQECEQGETAWAEIPEDGGEEPDTPAAGITLAAGDDHAAASDDAQGAAEPASAPAGENAAAVSADDLDGKASKGLAIGGLVVGVVGLLAGLTGITLAGRARRSA